MKAVPKDRFKGRSKDCTIDYAKGRYEGSGILANQPTRPWVVVALLGSVAKGMMSGEGEGMKWGRWVRYGDIKNHVPSGISAGRNVGFFTVSCETEHIGSHDRTTSLRLITDSISSLNLHLIIHLYYFVSKKFIHGRNRHDESGQWKQLGRALLIAIFEVRKLLKKPPPAAISANF